jgi:hypothetical protein
MPSNPLQGDSKPWYRQFWPWFLIMLPATVVIASLYTVYIAIHGADDLVVDDYYRDGLAINLQLEKKQLAESLGVSAKLNFSGKQVTVQVAGPVTADSLLLMLSHPIEADHDFSLLVVRTAPGTYRGQLPSPASPHWHWTLELDQDDGWRLDGDLEQRDFDAVASQ